MAHRGGNGCLLHLQRHGGECAWLGWAGRAGGRATGGGIPAVPALRNLQAHQHTPFLPNQPHFCHTKRALQKKETNIATTAANTALGVLCLWRGFKKDSGGSSLAK